MNAKERFRSKIIKIGGCWLWTGRTNAGCPVFEIDGRRVQAKRWAWNRGPRPEYIGNTCGERLCVRPYHLVGIKPRAIVEPQAPDEIVRHAQHNPHTATMRRFGLTLPQLIEILDVYYFSQPATQDQSVDASEDSTFPLHRFRI